MSDIVIRQVDKVWGAFHNDRKVSGSACRNCVIRLMMRLTKNSTRYSTIHVIGKNGIVVEEYKTGVNHVRQSN